MCGAGPQELKQIAFFKISRSAYKKIDCNI